MSELPQVQAPRCMFLGSKAMAVHGEAFASDPDFDAGLSAVWCMQTGRGLGPDGGDVSLAGCCNKERDCYREY